MATNPGGIHGAIFDPRASNGLGGLNTGIGFGINTVYGPPLPAGFEALDAPDIAVIGSEPEVAAEAVGHAGDDVAIVTATATVATGAQIGTTGFSNETGRTITSGQSVLGVAV